MKRILTITIAAALLAGCSATASNWKRAGASPAQADADLRVCQYEANLAIGAGQQTVVLGNNMGAAIGASNVTNFLRIAELQALCMQARGYQQ